MTQTTLYHYNTLSALMSGLYQGDFILKDLLTKGNLGIGTLDYIDGELIILDDLVYQARERQGQLEVLAVSEDQVTPYAAIVQHGVSHCLSITQSHTRADLEAVLQAVFDSDNLFYSIKMTGDFAKMRVRVAPKTTDGKPFEEVAKNQAEFETHQVKGTVLGIWTPELFHGISVYGYHLHFLSDDRQFAGHVMDYTMTKGELEIGKIDNLHQVFPSQNPDFLEAKLDLDDLRQAITKSE